MRNLTILTSMAILVLTAVGCSIPTGLESAGKKSNRGGCTLFQYCGGLDLPTITVRGTVTDTASNPIQGIEVTLATGTEALTDAYGRYSVTSMTCHVSDNPSVSFKLGKTEREISIIGPPCQTHEVNIHDWPNG